MSSIGIKGTRTGARRAPPLCTAKSLPTQPSQGLQMNQMPLGRKMCNHNYTDWGFSCHFSFINKDNYAMTGGGSDPMGSVPGQDQKTGVLILPPLAGWPWTGHLLSLGCCSWQMRGVRSDSSDTGGFCDVFGSTLSLVLWSTTVTLLSWVGEAPHHPGTQGQDS